MIIRTSLRLAAVALSGLSLAAQDRPPIFAGRPSELVVLPVVVTDRRGSFVADLSQDRFAVYDNGLRQDLVFFSNEDTPVSVGLVIDDSGSMRPKLPDVVTATLMFARMSNPSDELFTIPFNDTVLNQTSGRTPVTGTQALETALRSLVPQGRTALYDALLAGLDRVLHGTHPRKALIVMSDGGDNASRATLESVMAQARRANVTIFTIGLFDDEDFDRNPGVLKSLAESTGRRAVPAAVLKTAHDSMRTDRAGSCGRATRWAMPHPTTTAPTIESVWM